MSRPAGSSSGMSEEADQADDCPIPYAHGPPGRLAFTFGLSMRERISALTAGTRSAFVWMPGQQDAAGIELSQTIAAACVHGGAIDARIVRDGINRLSVADVDRLSVALARGVCTVVNDVSDVDPTVPKRPLLLHLLCDTTRPGRTNERKVIALASAIASSALPGHGRDALVALLDAAEGDSWGEVAGAVTTGCALGDARAIALMRALCSELVHRDTHNADLIYFVSDRHFISDATLASDPPASSGARFAPISEGAPYSAFSHVTFAAEHPDSCSPVPALSPTDVAELIERRVVHRGAWVVTVAPALCSDANMRVAATALKLDVPREVAFLHSLDQAKFSVAGAFDASVASTVADCTEVRFDVSLDRTATAWADVSFNDAERCYVVRVRCATLVQNTPPVVALEPRLQAAYDAGQIGALFNA
jgi:hypothetical protein